MTRWATYDKHLWMTSVWLLLLLSKREVEEKREGERIKRCAILQYTLLWTMHMHLPFGDLKFDGSHMTALPAHGATAHFFLLTQTSFLPWPTNEPANKPLCNNDYVIIVVLHIRCLPCSSSVFEALLLAMRGCSRNESVFKSPLLSTTNRFA